MARYLNRHGPPCAGHRERHNAATGGLDFALIITHKSTLDNNWVLISMAP